MLSLVAEGKVALSSRGVLQGRWCSRPSKVGRQVRWVLGVESVSKLHVVLTVCKQCGVKGEIEVW
jgi:hypothetical protein